MLDSAEYRELRNGKRYQTSIECTMSDHGSKEENATGISSENIKGEVSAIQTLIQEAFNEQIRGFIAPLTRQLQELTRLVQGMTTTWHPNYYPRTDFGTNSGTATHQSDKLVFQAKILEWKFFFNRSRFLSDLFLHADFICRKSWRDDG